MKELILLNGWKEIANYMRLSLRTVQRYEKAFGLPVRRSKTRIVFAVSHEIDAWYKTAPIESFGFSCLATPASEYPCAIEFIDRDTAPENEPILKRA